MVQMVFQDPNAALNPSMTVEEAVGDAAAGARDEVGVANAGRVW